MTRLCGRETALYDAERWPVIEIKAVSSYEHAEHEALHWISFYNAERLHEELGDVPPAEYERINYKRGNTSMASAR